MLKQVRKQIVETLWQKYCDTTPQMQLIEKILKRKSSHQLPLDHFAIIDLPGPYTGIPYLSELFSLLGFEVQGKDYLADKQNDFLWLAEPDSKGALAKTVLPQVVVADFRLQEMPCDIQEIIKKYAGKAKPAPLETIKKLITNMDSKAIVQLIADYFQGRDWPLPTVSEYKKVCAFNELLAWVLVFGRRPNHFTLSIHLLTLFSDLKEFHGFIERETTLKLNQEGGEIKGDAQTGIAQGSTKGACEIVALADGEIEIATGFVEFVWRYPRVNKTEYLWDDYFTGFIAQHADRVIESLYREP